MRPPNPPVRLAGVLRPARLVLPVALLALLAPCRERGRLPESTGIEPLKVEATLPRGETSRRGSIDVIFDRPMVQLGERPPSLEAGRKLLEIEPLMEGSYHWIGTRTLSWSVPGGLPEATVFRARVPAGTKALDGSRLAEDVAWEFATPRPEIVASVPAPGDSLFAPDDPVVLLFNMPVEPRAVGEVATLDETGGLAAARPDSALLAELDPRFVAAEPERLVILRPRAALALDSDHRLVIGTGLRARTGTRGPESPIDIAFRTHGAPEFLDATAESPALLTLRFRTPVDADSARAFLVLDPPATITGAWTNGRVVYLYGEFGFEKTYDVTMRAGLPDLFGQRLATARTLQVTTGQREKSLQLLPYDAVLLPTTSRTVALVHSGLGPVRFRVARLSVLDEIRSQQQPATRPRRWAIDRRFPAEPDSTRLVTENLDVSAALPRGGLGAVVVEASSARRDADGNEREWEARAVLRWSDLGITLKSSPENGLVWVTRLATGKAVPKAALRIVDTKGAEVWRGRTTESGLAELPGLRELGREPWELVLVAAAGADTATSSFLPDWRLDPWQFGIPGDYGGQFTDHRVFLYSDRDLYRPGDTIRVAGLVRRTTTGGLAAATAESLQIAVRDPMGASFASLRVAVDRTGGFDFDLPTTGAARLGRYAIEVVVPVPGTRGGRHTIGSHGVQLSAYRAAPFRTRVHAGSRKLGRGEPLAARIEGSYYFGAPLASAPYTLSIVRETSPFRPTGFEDFSFWEPDLEISQGGPLHSSSGALDDSGRAVVRVELPPELPAVPQAIHVEATVRDPSGDAVSGRTTVAFLPAAAYAGIAVEPRFVIVGQSITARVVAVRSDTALAAVGVPLAVELVRHEWRSVRKLLVGGRVGFETARLDTVLETREATSGVDPVELEFAPPEPGSYSVRARAAGADAPPGVTGFWVAGERSGGWPPADALRLELTTDRESYRVGDVARVLVTTPMQAKTLLLTVEREGLLESRLVRADSGSQVFEIPIRAEYLPNVYVGLAAAERALSPREAPGLPEPARLPRFALGYVPLRVDVDSRRLAVAVHTDHAEYRPGDKIGIDIEVRDASGQGAAARVGVAVVDEAVLALLGTPPPNPFRFFYAERPLATDNRDTRLRLSAGSRLEAAAFKGEAGGDGAERLAARSLFTTTAYWNPAVQTDAGGRAHVEVTLPDNLTSFRVAAVAASGVDRFGTGTGSFRVAKPLIIEPALPRFAYVGDTLEVAAVVTNRGAETLRGRVRLTTDLRLLGKAESTVEVAAGASRRISVRSRAERAGGVPLRFEALFGNQTDAVETKLAVLEPVVPQVAATAAHTERPVVERVGVPPNSIPGTARLEVALAASALAGARPAIDYVVQYPYPCLEQVASRLVVLTTLYRVFAASTADSTRLAADVAEAVRRVESHASQWGSFSFWQGGPEAPPWIAAWATFALARAQAAGFEVTPTILDNARFALARAWREAGIYGRRRDAADPQRVRVLPAGLALLAFAQLLEPKPETMIEPADVDYFADHVGELAVDEQLFLGLALDRWAMRPDVVRQVLDSVLREVEVTAGGAAIPSTVRLGVEGPFRSAARPTSLTLWLAARERPRDPMVARLASGLLAMRAGGHWTTTQDDAVALLALEAYRDAVESTAGTVEASVRVHGAAEPLLALAAPAGALAVRQATFDLPLEGRTGPVDLEIATRGLLHYTGVLRWQEDALRQPIHEAGYTLVRRIERYPTAGPMRLGDLGVVTLQIVVPRESWYLAVVDPLPGGLEIVQSEFQVESRQLSGELERWRGDHDPFPVSFAERTDRELRLFADAVPAGVYEHRYVVRVRAAGGFAHLPARIEAMYAPELHGATAAQRFRAQAPAKAVKR